jgi:hypothetical protein
MMIFGMADTTTPAGFCHPTRLRDAEKRTRNHSLRRLPLGGKMLILAFSKSDPDRPSLNPNSPGIPLPKIFC